MNNDFPRILSLLRKERGLSQKKAADDLGLAQALLSHYEKGKRECGLGFLVRAADYYNVSADYLLGRCAVRDGAFITENDIPDSDVVEKAGAGASSVSVTLSKKLIVNSIELIYSLLAKINSHSLTAALSDFLTHSVYSCFRLIYRVNPKNNATFFAIKEEQALRSADAARSMAEGRALSEPSNPELPQITTASLENDYKRQGAALLSLIKNSEHGLKKL